MPHVLVKLWPGKSEQQKARLAEAIARNVMDALHYGDDAFHLLEEELDRVGMALNASTG
jgi:4-oxalocrotonate tautomerase